MKREHGSETQDSGHAENQPVDPRLRLFLRQAGAIIAAERGLSESCRLRLQSLAVRLELTSQQFHQAIETLQGTAKFSEALNHWERSFVEFLQREFKPFQGRVLSIAIENRALDLAARKYQIQEVRAHELIQTTSEQLGIGRIAEADAVWFGNRLIVDTLGSQQGVEPAQLRELYRIGEQWGLDRETVDQRIQQTLADNTRSKWLPKTWRWPIIGTIVCMAALSLMMLAWQMVWFPTARPHGFAPDMAGDVSGLSRSEKPTGWSESLAKASAQIKSSHFASIETSMLSADGERRLLGLRRLIELAKLEPQNADSVNHLVALIYFAAAEPEVEDCVLQSLEKSLDRVSQPDFVTARQVVEGFGAIRLLSAVLYDSVEIREESTSSRLEPARDLALRFLGLLPDGMKRAVFVAKANRELALDLWNQLVHMSYRSPSESAALVDHLSAVTRPMLDPEIFFQVRSTAVLTMLDNDMNHWKTIQKTLAELIASSNQSQAIQWIDRLIQMDNQTAADFIAGELVKRLDVSIIGDEPAEKRERLNEVRSAYRLGRFPIVLTNPQIDQFELPLETLAIEKTRVSPELIARLTHSSNLSLAYIAELKTAQDHPLLKELLREGVPRLESRGQIAPPLAKGPTPSEIREKKRAFERLKLSLGTDRLAVRTSAFSALADIASRFRDFSYEEAAVLADYALAPSELKEWLMIEGLLPKFSHLPNMHLATADWVGNFSGQSDRVLTIYRLLTDQDCKLDPPERWRQCVQHSLVIYALGILQSRVDSVASAEKDGETNVAFAWEQLGRYQEDAFAMRVSILDRWSGNTFSPSGGYSEALAGLYASSEDEPGRLRSLRGLAIADNGPPIVRAVVLNQLLIDFLSAELRACGSGRAEEVESLLPVYYASMKKNASNDRRLLITEFFLWKLAALLRKEKTSELQEKARG